jgi:hypothetical protein
MGMLDDEDVRMVAYGKAYNLIWQEYWNNFPIKGLFEPSFTPRNAQLLRQKVSAIIFIPELKFDILEQAYLAINPVLNLEFDFQSIPAFSGLIKVMSALWRWCMDNFHVTCGRNSPFPPSSRHNFSYPYGNGHAQVGHFV